MINAAQLGAIHAQTMRNIRALAGARAKTRSPYLGYVKHGQIEENSRVNKKTDKAVIGKVEAAKWLISNHFASLYNRIFLVINVADV